MKISFAVLAATCLLSIIAQAAQAETYKYRFEYVIRVNTQGLQEHDKQANRDIEFYLSIEARSDRGKSSYCRKTGCIDTADIVVVERKGDEARSVTL